MFIVFYCYLLVRVQPLSLVWVDSHHTKSIWALFQGPIIEFWLGYPIFYYIKILPQQLEKLLKCKKIKIHFKIKFTLTGPCFNTYGITNLEKKIISTLLPICVSPLIKVMNIFYKLSINFENRKTLSTIVNVPKNKFI